MTVYRVRHDYTAVLNNFTETCTMREPATGFHQDTSNMSLSNVIDANYIKDELHYRRTRGFGKGRYPPGYGFHGRTDLSKVVPMNDVIARVGGIDHLEQWDTGRVPLLYPPGGGISYVIGTVADLPDAFFGRVPSSIVNALSEEAWNYFSDVLPTHLNFSEFVQGFTQLKDLLPSLGESITGTVSKGYLNKKFGWDNLLQDLGTLSHLFDDVHERMDYFRRTYGIPTRLGFSRRIDWTPTGPEYPHTFAINYATDMTVEIDSFSAVFRATAWIMQHLDYMTDLVGFMRVLFGELGLNNPVKAFWNVIPLSFVVDWFFKISTHLDNLTRLNPPTGWDVDDVTQSVSYDIVYKFVQRNTYDARGSHYPVASWLAPSKWYERQKYLSFQWELLNPEELSPTQLTLLLAMLHQFSGG